MNVLSLCLTSHCCSAFGKTFTSKPRHGKVGIINQGATCYLNALLQYLFNDIAFKSMIWKADSTVPLIRSFQLFFGYLSLSECSAISSSDLITSFGWSASQIFEQHDIHELFSVLLDALSQSSEYINDEIKKLYCGVVMGESYSYLLSK